MSTTRSAPFATLALVLCGAASLAHGQRATRAPTAPASHAAPAEPLVIEHVRGGIYMIGGAGGNITVQIGSEGVLLVDAGRAERSEAVLEAVRRLTRTPVTMIINTHHHLESTGGNAAIARSGRSVSAARRVENRAAIWGHENVLARVSAEGANGQPLIPSDGWPIDTYFNSLQDIFFNGEAVQLHHTPQAHTEGDTVVFFRRSDVIAAGDVFSTSRYPMLREEDGGNIEGVIRALNRIIELTVPDRNQEGGTMVIPGHGHVGDEYDVVIYRDALTVIRDRIQDMIDRGMTLEQVKAARPTLDYDGMYGVSEGPWTTDMFVEAVYRNLREQRQ